ncbi:MAG TPA: hypothetical protein VFX49_06585, partial [Chloroflexota bacterium]|nr:hypothetical protein [Chloroflexota bacterium]
RPDMAIHREHVVGVFESRREAERVVEELRNAGFAQDDIGYAIRTPGSAVAGGHDGADLEAAVPEAAGGAATGALTGGLLGGLIGAAAALVVPGVGPVLAGGILASALGGAAIGAAAGGVLGGLVGLGVPEEEVAFYEGELHAGRAVVTVRAAERVDAAREIMHRHGARRREPVTGDIPRGPEAHRAQAEVSLPTQTNPS